MDACNVGLQAAEAAAAIPVHAIAVIAFFAGVEDAVSAAGKGAVCAAICSGGIGIEGAVVTFFSGIDGAVATCGGDVAAVDAIVGERGIVEGGFTLFSKERLDFAVAADAHFQKAVA